MAVTIWSYVQNSWPFSAFKFDDLKASDKLIKQLPIHEHTKQFLFAVREPESNAVIYVLCVQDLSERSVLDADHLIREVRPDAVVAQVGHSVINEIRTLSMGIGSESGVDDSVPTSSLGVLKRCFVHRINKEKYEDVAAGLVLREIFGVGFECHFLAAKKAAEGVGSRFLLLESPFVKISSGEVGDGEGLENTSHGLNLHSSSLVPFGSRRSLVTNDLRLQLVRSLSSHLSHSSFVPQAGSGDIQPRVDYEAPKYAQSFYPLLVGLHDTFQDIPLIGRALALAQQMLYDVNGGQIVDNKLLSEVYIFRIAVEGLRIALNNEGRMPINKLGNPNSNKVEFSDLPVDDKSHTLLAHALRIQAKRFKSVVAIVDARGLAGLRKHWNTPVSPEVKEMVENMVTDFENYGESKNHDDRKLLLTYKPVVAVGAGATAVLGASSFSKFVPASTIMKVVTFKVPASLKIMMTQTQKAIAIALSKAFGPSKLVGPGIANSGVKTSALKAAASTEKIRAVAHSMIASAEKTSLSAMRTAFYEIMRKRRVRPIGFLPWATFGCSVGTCTGLLVYGDGIECAVESLPAAPSIASLGRGIQSLHQASEAVKEVESFRIQKSIESLFYRLRRKAR
ncbi:hypothetical protein RJ639_010919 [Escallonia herrerae]|uniref:Uncharacterized protein n=1 Tax=Escallonia herrerae TaxID=1293975 RepID=A0AA89AMX0_9ASTE|nr:hypothetical protein RJ639_010919 [Escallonia herrerae]